MCIEAGVFLVHPRLTWIWLCYDMLCLALMPPIPEPNHLVHVSSHVAPPSVHSLGYHPQVEVLLCLKEDNYCAFIYFLFFSSFRF